METCSTGDDLERLFPSASGDQFEQDLVQLLGLQRADCCSSPDELHLLADGLVVAPPPPPPGAHVATTKQEPQINVGSWFPSTSASGSFACTEPQDGAQSEKTAHPSQPKRRRRTRNEKQQELNRLAQQRYRKRKKEKAQQLAEQVDDLADQLANLRSKDEEIAILKRTKAALEQTVAAQQSALNNAKTQLAEQEDTLTKQQQQLTEQQCQLASALERAQRPFDAAALSERLATALRDALAELGANVDKHAVDKLTSALTRSLTSCGKDARTLLASLPKMAVEQRSPSMTVSCC